jgi:hypothetical protein
MNAGHTGRMAFGRGGHEANERPLRFDLDDCTDEISEVEARCKIQVPNSQRRHIPRSTA